MDFSGRLKICRKNKGATQKQTAVAIGLAERNYQRYESGEQEPGLHYLVALADYFGVSLDYLVGRSDVPHVAKEESK